MKNILNRIRKLESGAIGSEFCVCHLQRYEIYHQDLTSDSKTHEPQLKGEAVPDVCADCAKPIEKKQIIFRICDRDTPNRLL